MTERKEGDELDRFFHELRINGHTIDPDRMLEYVQHRECVYCGLIAYCDDYQVPLSLGTEFGPIERMRRSHECGAARKRRIRRLRDEASRTEAEIAQRNSQINENEEKLVHLAAQARIKFEDETPVSEWLPADAYPPELLAETIHQYWREHWSIWPTIDSAAEAIAAVHRITVERARQMLAYVLDQPGTCIHLTDDWLIEVDRSLHAELDKEWLRERRVRAWGNELRRAGDERR